MKALFLLSLATAKRVGKLQALSFQVAYRGPDLSLSYLPEFVAKTQSERNSLPHSFLGKSLTDFVGDLPEERLLCPVRAVRIYLDLTSFSPRPRSLFVSPRCPSRSLSKNALSFFVRSFLMLGPPRVHSIRGMGTSATFFEKLVSLQGVRGSNLEIESSFCCFLFQGFLHVGHL